MMGSTPAVIERTLTLRILRGVYPAGTRLPTVRQLAAKFRVNQATIQRVVARLETRGLIRARQGSGLAVTDASALGDLALMPLWIEAAIDDPDRAVHLLDGVLEVRRVIASRLLVRHRDLLLARLGETSSDAAAVARAAQQGSAAFCAADLAFARRLLGLVESPVALALFNTVARVLEDVPLVAEAMYAEPRDNLASMVTVIAALRGDVPGDLGATIERAMGEVDRKSVQRFAALLREKGRRT
jgi:DNA-binding FadR family transcriptional regulator